MGLDSGATFTTDSRGNGTVKVTLDYDLIQEAPVATRYVSTQCVPSVAADGTCTGTTDLGIPRRVASLTTTWLRGHIGDYDVSRRALSCANYDQSFDPDTGAVSQPAGIDARYWQCVDPATGRPRVPRFTFDHFRLAPHPDGLTHGLIGGNSTEHFIDMVGRRCDIAPSVGAQCP
jgi:hypothetical protein